MEAKNENQTNNPMKPVMVFEDNMKKYQNTVAGLLGEKYGISPEEFMIMAVNTVKKSPKLLECDQRSLFAAFLMAAECGLRPNAPDGCCYILPYGNQAQFQIGYKGIIEMAYRNSRVLKMYGEAVYEKDYFEFEQGLEQKLVHKPLMNGDRGKLICVYAVCKMKDAEPMFTVVFKSELDKIQKLSPAGSQKFSPYNNGTDIHNFMQIKAAFKKLLKTVPKNSMPELTRAIHVDSAMEGGAKLTLDDMNKPQIIEEVHVSVSTEKVNTSDKLEKLKEKSAQTEVPLDKIGQ